MSTPPTNEFAPLESSMVLLVDDQAMIGEAVRRCLANQAEIDFHFCANPAEAVNLAVKLKPAVILQDLVMPGFDGIDLVRQYRSHPELSRIPIIVLSMKEEAQVKSNAFTAGANDYLVKLPDKIELVARIRYHARAYMNQIQRDEAFRALQESQRQLVQVNTALLTVNQELADALGQVKQLRGLLPICCYCRKIRDDGNYWSQIETYVIKHSDATFSHGICPECARKHFGSLYTAPSKE